MKCWMMAVQEKIFSWLGFKRTWARWGFCSFQRCVWIYVHHDTWSNFRVWTMMNAVYNFLSKLTKFIPLTPSVHKMVKHALKIRLRIRLSKIFLNYFKDTRKIAWKIVFSSCKSSLFHSWIVYGKKDYLNTYAVK